MKRAKYELEYLQQVNREIIVRMIDSFMYFVYQGCRKLKPNRHFGMILPDVVLYQKDNEKLRNFILKNFKINFLLNMGNVFEKVTRPSSILIFERSKSYSSKNVINTADLSTVDKVNKPSLILDESYFVV
ncbi:MAG: hypothetical protein SCARUB_01318 [Candidatus Scalindua rubra]|uniref:site-specific DNA-methyltransferase (adenine-specific) n=1 Tax=Candidatus Scalindua rubra TaxID=1872076 RepID=A0A1E3XF60_9BACT|nr:MAG: hypothetical protein SCARUB_01318 [Candidatus Scalindua rubra]